MIYRVASTVPHDCTRDIVMSHRIHIHTQKDRGLSASMIREACVR